MLKKFEFDTREVLVPGQVRLAPSWVKTLDDSNPLRAFLRNPL